MAESQIAVQDRTVGALERFNPFSPELHADPQAYYRRYRTQEPIHWGLPYFPGVDGSWYVTRYDHAVAALKHPQLIREYHRLLPPEAARPLPESVAPYLNSVRRSMQFRDPPDHTRLRQLVNKAFSPSVVEALRPHTAQIAEVLLDWAQPTGRLDIINEYAFPLTVTILAEMLGVHAEDRETLKQWAIDLIAAMDLRQTNLGHILAAANQAVLDAAAYLRKLIAERRGNPKPDLLSALVEAEEKGDKLTEDELITNCTLLIMAGFETTVNLIGNSLVTLLQNPDHLALLRDDPSLIETAVEELARYNGPAQMTGRFAFEDIKIGGQPIKRGESVTVVYASANHDPEQFTDADELDFRRANNRHLAFGAGIHFCTGAPLARIEAQVAINALLRRMPRMKLLTNPLRWNGSLAARGVKELVVSF